MEVLIANMQRMSERMAAMEAALNTLVHEKTVKDWYSTAEIAELLGKAEFTVREWCRLGRIHAEKRQSGRGPHAAWVVSREELQRYYRNGLIPQPTY